MWNSVTIVTKHLKNVIKSAHEKKAKNELSQAFTLCAHLRHCGMLINSYPLFIIMQFPCHELNMSEIIKNCAEAAATHKKMTS